MRLRKRAVATLFLVTVACGALGPGASAAPLPWDSHKAPAVSQGSESDGDGPGGHHDSGYHDSGDHQNGYHDS